MSQKQKKFLMHKSKRQGRPVGEGRGGDFFCVGQVANFKNVTFALYEHSPKSISEADEIIFDLQVAYYEAVS